MGFANGIKLGYEWTIVTMGLYPPVVKRGLLENLRWLGGCSPQLICLTHLATNKKVCQGVWHYSPQREYPVVVHILYAYIYIPHYMYIYIYISLSLFCHLSRLHTFRYEPGKLCWIHKPEMKLFWISFRFLAHDKLCDLLYPFYQPISNFCHFIQYLLFPSQFVWE